ncbi:MAG TPA: cobalt ECF transporter T component CbiQ [Bacillota bacterium]
MPAHPEAQSGLPGLPAWLLEQDAGRPEGDAQAVRPGRRGRGRGAESFIDHTLAEMAHTTRHAVFAEEIARRPGFLQGLDARVKLGSFLALILAVAVVRSPLTLALATGAVVFAAARSRVPASFLLGRVWLLVAAFTAVMALPSAFDWVRPGPVAFYAYHVVGPVHVGPLALPSDLAVTWTGLRGAVLLVLRAAGSATLAAVLTLTTRWDRLLASLQGLGLPAAFVSVFDLAYRYLFVAMGAALETFEARRARTVGRLSLAADRGFAAGVIGSALTRARAMSDEVQEAMVARGYDGTIKLDRPPVLTSRSVLRLAAGVALAYLLFIFDRILGLLGG